MALPLAEYFPDGLVADAEPVEHAGPAPYLRRPLDADSAGKLARALRYAERPRVSLPRILNELHTVHLAWRAVRSPLREEAVDLIHRATGYPQAVIDRHLRKQFQAFIHPMRLVSWITLGEQGALSREAYGPRLTVVISSGNIPGAALPSILFALLLQSPCLVKTSSLEPFLLPLYARSLADRGVSVAEHLVVTGWEGGNEAVEAAVLRHADALVAFGGETALASLRRHLRPEARFVPHGHRISFTAIARECITRRAARHLARAVALDAAVFDQQGCLSPQSVYVEEGGEVDPGQFAEAVAGELERLERIIPRRALSPKEAAAIHQYRADREMRSFSDSRFQLWCSPNGTSWTVALEPPGELQPCPLNRTVSVQPVPSLEYLPGLLTGVVELLLSAGLAAPHERRSRLARQLTACGVTRITRPGWAQRPEAGPCHDGIHGVAALARYAVFEK